MEQITKENITKNIQEILEEGDLNFVNLERFVLLCRAKKYLCREMHKFGEEEAHEWVSGMHPAARWSMEQTSAVMKERGFYHKPCVFWAVMNSLASDYGATMAKYGADRPEVWADLANDWLSDEDAVPEKTETYFREIVKHE